jgi:hypothetical protein
MAQVTVYVPDKTWEEYKQLREQWPAIKGPSTLARKAMEAEMKRVRKILEKAEQA